MNGLVRRVLSSPAVCETDLKRVADGYAKVGPVPTLAILAKLANRSKLSSVECTVVNRLLPKLMNSVPFLPPNLGLKTFNTLALLSLPESRRALSQLQDKWFDNWHPANLERSTKRPKKKLAMPGIYEPNVKAFPTLSLTALSDTTLTASLSHLDELLKYQYLNPIIYALRNEAKKRDSAKSSFNTEIS